MDLGLTVDRAVRAAEATPEQPTPLVCECGESYPWVWHVPRTSRREYPGRWAAPTLNPCERCKPVSGMDDELLLRQRIRDAGIPDAMVGYRLDVSQGYLVTQEDDETPDEFRARIAGMRDGVKRIGVLDINREAIRELYRWRPPAWLVLHGPVGTGKTTLISALVRKLLEQPPDVIEQLPEERFAGLDDAAFDYATSRGLTKTLRRKAVPIVEYHRVDDLVRREAIKARGLDPNPTADAAKRPHVLILDELGLTERPTESETKMIERILCYRADHGICTVMATNRTWDELVGGKRPLYGRRVADRLKKPTEVALLGESWR